MRVRSGGSLLSIQSSRAVVDLELVNLLRDALSLLPCWPPTSVVLITMA